MLLQTQKRRQKQFNAFYAILNRILLAFETLSISLIASIILSQFEFGKFVFLITLIGIPLVFSDLAIGQSMIYFHSKLVAQEKNRINEYSYSILLNKILVFTLISVILYYLVNYLSVIGISMIPFSNILFFYTYCYGLGILLLNHVRHLCQIFLVFHNSLLMDIILLALIWLFFLFQQNFRMNFILTNFFNILLLLCGFSLLIGNILTHKDFLGVPKLRQINKFLNKEFVMYSLLIAISGFAALIFNRVDVYVLSIFRDEKAVAIFGVALLLYGVYSIIFEGINMVSFSYVSKRFHENRNIVIKSYWQAIVVFNVCLALPYTLILLVTGEFLVTLIFGINYHFAADLLRIIAFAGLIRSFSNASSVIFISTGKANIIVYLTCVSAFTGTLLSLILVPSMGLYGSAFSILTNQIISVFVSILVFLKATMTTFKDLFSFNQKTFDSLKEIMGLN